MSDIYSETERHLDDHVKEKREQARISDNIVVSSHFRVADDVEVVTGVFPLATPIGDVMRWAKTCRYSFARTPKPFRIVINTDDSVVATDD